MPDSRRWLQSILTLIGVACLSWLGFVTVHAAIYQREQTAQFERLRAAPLPGPPPTIVEGAPAADTDLIGMLDIPRLSVSTPVVRGDDAATLELAAGHLPDTPRPWEPGNSAIAGHRDGLFRPLKDIQVGDAVVMRTIRGDFRYRVRDTRIVMPHDLSVLSPTGGQTLTLITCYPFHYVGAAPKRFIVHAERVDTPATSLAPRVRGGDERLDAPKPLDEERQLHKPIPRKASLEKRKPRRSLAKRPKPTTPTVTPPGKSSANDGKVRKFFRKIGALFKQPKPAPAGERQKPRTIHD